MRHVHTAHIALQTCRQNECRAYDAAPASTVLPHTKVSFPSYLVPKRRRKRISIAILQVGKKVAADLDGRTLLGLLLR